MQKVEAQLDAGRLEVVIVGETMFTNSIDTLAKFDWLAVVFDEVHHFKNPATKKCGDDAGMDNMNFPLFVPVCSDLTMYQGDFHMAACAPTSRRVRRRNGAAVHSQKTLMVATRGGCGAS